MAASAIVGLQRHNLSVPYDIAVTGFDDEIRATSSSPTLTTIRASFPAITRLGTQRLQMLINKMSVPATTEVYPTDLIIRQSCGCLPQSLLAASSKIYKPQKGIVLNINFLQMNQAMAEALGSASGQLPEGWQKQLWDAFIRSLKSAKPKAFIQKLDLLERQTLEQGTAADQWQHVLSIMRNYAVNTFSNQIVGLAQQVEDLFNQGRIFTSEMTEHSAVRSGLSNEDKNSRLLDTIQTLLKTFSMDGLMDVLSNSLPRNLKIPAVYLAVYEDAQWPPKNARLMMAYNEKQGRIDLGQKEIVFPAEQVLPSQYLPRGRRFHLIAAPLYFQNENLGFVVFEAGPIDALYAPIQKLIASALKGALLFRQRDDLVKNIASSASQVTSTSIRLEEIVNGTKEAMNQITQSMNQISSGASEQAAVVNKAVVSIDSMSASSIKIASEAQIGNESAAQTAHNAKTGAELGNAALNGMQEIKAKVELAAEKVREMSNHSLKISVMVETIEDISVQTNMLALNAAIEAARAGEQGRGFAIVASEVRKLAEKSSTATKEISSVINTIQQTISEAVKAMEISSLQVSSGSVRAGESNEAMEDIQKAAESLYQRVQSISAAATEIAKRSNEMTHSIEDIASVTEENTATTEEVNASAEEINGQMEEMAEMTRVMAEMARGMQELVTRYQ
jgi:methyl-accepting chemotaxis protein/uncharacterized protein YigA (DUF484 family)